MSVVRLTIELEVTAPAGDAVALARSIVTRQGLRVVDTDAVEPVEAQQSLVFSVSFGPELNGIRDHDAPCRSYFRRQLGGFNERDCAGDGHYLCRGCSHHDPREEETP